MSKSQHTTIRLTLVTNANVEHMCDHTGWRKAAVIDEMLELAFGTLEEPYSSKEDRPTIIRMKRRISAAAEAYKLSAKQPRLLDVPLQHPPTPALAPLQPQPTERTEAYKGRGPAGKRRVPPSARVRQVARSTGTGNKHRTKTKVRCVKARSGPRYFKVISKK